MIHSGFANIIKISKVETTCNDENCKLLEDSVSNLKGDYYSLSHLKEVIKQISDFDGVNNLKFELYEDGSEYTLSINASMSPIVSNIKICWISEI